MSEASCADRLAFLSTDVEFPCWLALVGVNPDEIPSTAKGMSSAWCKSPSGLSKKAADDDDSANKPEEWW